MAKFKVGDKVVGNHPTRYTFTKEGWTGVVTKVFCDGSLSIRGEGNKGGWNTDFNGLEEEYFDLVEHTNKDKIVITHDGKITTATLYGEFGKKETATARCAPEDKFDFKVGAKLALERLVYEPPVEEKPLYNGKVVCVTCNPGNEENYTVGKIYEFKNGRLTTDNGSIVPLGKKIHSFDDFKKFSAAGFIEIVE